MALIGSFLSSHPHFTLRFDLSPLSDETPPDVRRLFVALLSLSSSPLGLAFFFSLSSSSPPLITLVAKF